MASQRLALANSVTIRAKVLQVRQASAYLNFHVGYADYAVIHFDGGISEVLYHNSGSLS